MDLWSGRPYPMGATLDPQGTNFAVFSSRAQAGDVSLCLFGEDGSEERLPLTHRDGSVWHGYVPGVRAGQRYGFRLRPSCFTSRSFSAVRFTVASAWGASLGRQGARAGVGAWSAWLRRGGSSVRT